MQIPRAVWPDEEAFLDKSKIVDTLTLIDMRWSRMLRLWRRSKELAVEFCDRCAKVCDAGCRTAAIRERALALRDGVRF
jgi:hypothetical protein